MKHSIFIFYLFVVVFFSIAIKINCEPVPDDYKKGTISEQLNQLENRTRIYENYRAIREDIFQQVNKNIKDSIKVSNKRIADLLSEIAQLNTKMDTTNKRLEATRTNLTEMTRTKNSIRVLGIEVNKTVYNPLMWSIISLAVLLLAIGYLVFKKNRSDMLKGKKELADLKKEYEDYRQKKRIEHEKLTMSHFNEIKKLKGDSPNR